MVSDGAAAAPGATVARRRPAVWAALDSAPGYRRVAGTGVSSLLALAAGAAVGVVALTTDSTPTVDPAVLDIGASTPTVPGGVPADGWLPVPRLLLMPFTALVGTRLAVTLLGVACLVVAAAALYRLTVRISLGRGGRIAALLVLVAAPTTLYQETTTTTGPVLIAALLATVAGLARWARVKRTPSGGELAIFAGIPCAIAVLTRYEGWLLLVGGVVFIALAAHQKGRGPRFALRMIASFAAVPAVGVAWWLAYNFSTRGTAFAGAPDAAAALGLPSTTTAEVPPQGLLRSMTEALPADVTGAVAVVVVLIGVAAAVLRYRWSDRLWVVGLLGAVAAADVVVLSGALAAGGPGWVGRTALPVIPALALTTGLAVDFARRAVRARSAVTAVLPAALAVALVGTAVGVRPGADDHAAAGPVAAPSVTGPSTAGSSAAAPAPSTAAPAPLTAVPAPLTAPPAPAGPDRTDLP
ncbi:glycosyltransferase family 39 protein [Nakamurella deserti]|uniref:glycosyltransferase family 39 protein n=1 Tax=Nakamurella deserti TaxID=2164074 RepID=UPI000DBE9FD0|nr:glycosyltransferase family 39 protein [Nakamurella deserti]